MKKSVSLLEHLQWTELQDFNSFTTSTSTNYDLYTNLSKSFLLFLLPLLKHLLLLLLGKKLFVN